MFRLIVAALILVSFLISDDSFAFEVDGLRSGMPFAVARALIESRSYENVDIKENGIDAWDAPSRATPRMVNLIFCKDRLVLVQKYLRPRFDDFVRLIDDKRKELGRPFDAWSKPTNVASGGKSDSVSLRWRAGLDFVTVSFAQFEANNQLDIVYETPNDCQR